MLKIKNIIRDKSIRDMMVVASSNMLVLISGIMSSFIVPHILGLYEYGIYKTFTLYISYSAIIELGFFEGIYLKYTAVPEEEWDINRFRAYFKVYFLINFIICFLLFGFVNCFFVEEKRIVLNFVLIYALASNVINYFQILSQCLLRFGEFALRNTIKSVMLICIIGSCYLAYIKGIKIGYISFISMYVSVFLFIVLWYVISYRRFVFGKAVRISSVVSDSKLFIQNGFPLLIANLCATFILTLDRQFVNILFSREKYAIYSFAYSMLALFTTLTSSISLVFFPKLKKISLEEVKDKYFEYETYLFILSSFFLILYFPLTFVVNIFLPKYSESLQIFEVVLPTLGFSIVISVLIQNYYKLLGKNRIYFYETVGVLIVSFALNLLFYKVFGTMIAISFASFVSTIIWYLLSYFMLRRYVTLKKHISISTIYYGLVVSVFWYILHFDRMGILAKGGIFVFFCVMLSCLCLLINKYIVKIM